MTWQELYNAQMELVDDKRVQEVEWLDWDFSSYYLKLTISEKYEIYEVLFMCDCFYSLVYSLKWILENTENPEVTVYIKGHSYVTFRSIRDMEIYFNHYYGKGK